MVKDVVNYREENNYTRNDLMQTLINMKNEKGTIVFVPVTGIHYDAEYWPDPTKFDPERFSQDNDKLNLGAFMAFGGGPKSCMGKSAVSYSRLANRKIFPGERMAWMIMKIAVISVLRRYRISVTDKFKTPA
ncbi:hypothetical protein NQ315_013510, partial [Exocentrus adspersus]